MTKSTKRNVAIDIETAKEWYKQGGDLRKVALQAFDESELKSLEYGDIIEYNGMKGYVVGFDEDGNPSALLSVDCWEENWYDAMDRKFSGGWHLPNKQFFEDHMKGIVATAKRWKWDWYWLWSSTEYSSNSAWGCGYCNGFCNYYGSYINYGKNGSNYVRAAIQA